MKLHKNNPKPKIFSLRNKFIFDYDIILLISEPYSIRFDLDECKIFNFEDYAPNYLLHDVKNLEEIVIKKEVNKNENV
jgi:hypothetical protein